MKKHILNRLNISIIGLCLLAISAVITIPKPFPPFTLELPHPGEKTFSVLSANIGNAELWCRKYLNKLCFKDVEQRIEKNIQYLSPDIIVLQEVLATWQCENDKNEVCLNQPANSQIERLVGSDYFTICNERNQFECIAVKKSIGTIKECDSTLPCNTARTVEYIDGCDNGFTISAATIVLKTGFKFDVINVHPQSTSVECRTKMLDAALKGTKNGGLIKENNVIVIGDFNLDPWRGTDTSAVFWNNFFSAGWNGKSFDYHNKVEGNEKFPPYTTYLFGAGKSVDFAVSNFAEGTLLTLGETPDTIRLDQDSGTDHRALFGFLTYK